MDIKSYACKSHKLDERMLSSSGGIFPLLAKMILSKKGVVYGVSMANNMKFAEFIRITNDLDLIKLQGSKYMQAHIGETFIKVKDDLEKGLLILFTGTACQINGLKCFLNDEYVNLYCIDVVCHGVPSPILWGKYVNYIEEQNEGKLIDVNFRCKNENLKSYVKDENKDNNKHVFVNKNEDPFMLMFLRDFCLRPSCYKCKAKIQKSSDISIADFWGIDKIAPQMNDEKGTSLIIVRTERGEELFNNIKDMIDLEKVSYSDAVKYNIAEYKSVKKPVERDIFFYDMNGMTFEALKEKYGRKYPVSIKKRIKKLLKKFIFQENSEKVSWSNFGLMFTFEMKEKKVK